MFTVHIDDSGTAPDQQIAIATAVIIPAARIPALNSEWGTLKRREGFISFHTSECVALNSDSEFSTWGTVKRDRVLSRVRQIGKKFGLVSISLAVKKSDYDQLIPDEMRPFTGNYHYTWAMRNMIALLDNWAKGHGVTLPFEYIYDWMDPKAQRRAKAEVDTVMAQAERQSADRGRPGRYINYSFRRREDVPALQCTDAIAWTCYQFSLFAMNKIPLSPIAQECWDDYYDRGSEWLYAGTMTKQQLQDWIDRELKDGRWRERFMAWEAEHSKSKTLERKRKRPV